MSLNAHVIKATIVGALGGLLFGFDTAVISGTTEQLTSNFHLTNSSLFSPSSLGFTVAIALWGTVLGATTAGFPGQRFGRRDSLRFMAVLYVISAIGCAFAWNLLSLDLFRFIGGIGIGGSSVLGPMYIAEIAPPLWRGRLVGFFQTNIVIGILLAYGSNLFIRSMHLGMMEWRWDLGVSGFPAILFFIVLFFIPRSPRWLLTQNRRDEALSVLVMTGVENAELQLRSISEAIAEERAASGSRLWTKRHRFPIFIAISVGAFCQLSGINAVLYYLDDIFRFAGATGLSSAMQSVAVGAMNLVATLCAMSVIDKFGRKKLLLTGTAGLALTLSAIAWVYYYSSHLALLVWLLMIYIAFFAISQGAVVWVYISEVFPTNVRSKGQSLGSSSHWIMNAIITVAFPVFARRSHSMPFVFFAAMMVLDFILVLSFYPETRGRSLETLQHHLDV
jgi:sugar porter (SP) family MFS transporter